MGISEMLKQYLHFLEDPHDVLLPIRLVYCIEIFFFLPRFRIFKKEVCFYMILFCIQRCFEFILWSLMVYWFRLLPLQAPLYSCASCRQTFYFFIHQRQHHCAINPWTFPLFLEFHWKSLQFIARKPVRVVWKSQLNPLLAWRNDKGIISWYDRE